MHQTGIAYAPPSRLEAGGRPYIGNSVHSEPPILDVEKERGNLPAVLKQAMTSIYSGMLHHPFKETGGMDGIVLNGADVEGGVHQQYTPGDATLPKTLA